MADGPIIRALVYGGKNRFQRAWLMGHATYVYTRSWDGAEGPTGEPMDFGRWYSFTAAVSMAWDHLWRKDC